MFVRGMATPSARERVAEELVVGAPPERIVDHVRAAEGGCLQVEAVVRHLLADAVDEHAVRAL
jgi:hypothetical protein